MADKYTCVACRKEVTKTKNDRYRSHSGGDGEPCEMSSEAIPEHVLASPSGKDDAPDVPRDGIDFAVCPQCDRKVKLTRMGYFEPHNTTLRGGERCEVSGVRAKHARKTDTVPLPGDEPLPPSAAVPEVKDSSTPAANRGLAITTGTETPGTGSNPSPESTDTPGGSSLPGESSPATSSDAPEGPAAVGPFHLAPLLDEKILQPFSHILQPTPYEKVQVAPMGDLAKELATRIKETFYSYSNRKTNDNRSAQTTLGPSEIGTPCDRRLAMALMGVPAVNPGGDGWAAFVGTCTHEGMANIYTFADAGTGRYAVELPVFLGVPTVPRGTTDLLDRRDGTVVDWKVMGKYSLDKFRKEGPSDTYRTQAHVYGWGAERGGEKVRNVAIVGLPRAGSSLDEMYVWTEKYDRKFAQDALARVERIANDISIHQASRQIEVAPPAVRERRPMEIAQAFEAGDDCRYCPFHLKGDKNFSRGCPGK